MPRKLSALILSFILFLPALPIGRKIVKPFSNEMLDNAMPWEITGNGKWLFIATDDGLIQFNGAYPQIFQPNNHRPLRSVNIDKENGRIYTGGISEFGYFQSSPISSLEYVCLSDSVGADRHIGNIWGIYPHDHELIAQGDNSILIYDLNNGTHKLINSENKLDVSSFIEDVLWLGTDDGLKLLLGNSIINVPQGDKLSGKRIRKILPYNGGLIIVTSDSIWIYKNQQMYHDPRFNALMSRLGEVFTAAIHGHTLAIGSVAHGVAIYDLEKDEFEIYDESNGLNSETVISLRFDETGNLLAGVQYGVAKINLTEPVEGIDNTLFPLGSGYVMLQKDKNLYIGSNRGLFRLGYDPERDRLGENLERIPGMRGQVWGLALIDGELFCSHDHGLYIIDSNDNSTRIGEISGVWDIRKMLGSNDRAYAGTYSGLHLLRKINGKWEYESPVEGYGNSVYNFAQQTPTIMWNNNAEEGIDRLVIDTLFNKISNKKIYTQTLDGTPLTGDTYISRIDNDIYFSTPKGIYIYDPKSEEIVKEREISRLLGNPGHVRRLKKTNGSLYALTDNELLQADPAGILDMKRISLSPVVAKPMFEGDVLFPVGNEYISYPVRNGYLFFNYSVNTDSLWQAAPPSVNIERLSLTNIGDSTVYQGNFSGLKYEPKLNHKENSVKIEYGNFEDIERGVLYSTRLNKEPWSAPSRSVSKELTDLREGRYRFEVKAISPHGEEATDYITFAISPPWWRAKWMLLIYTLFLITLAFFLVRWEQVRVNRKQQRILHEKNQEMEIREIAHRQESEEKDRHIEQLERDQLDSELKHKAQEVANAMMSLSRKNETLLEVKQELQKILPMLPRGNMDARRAIAALQEKVVVDLRSDDVLKRVEEEFDIIHNNFTTKLRENYPDLNNNEVLLCAYLKMNLSTKEIAPLLNISQRGVETMRYRLRKKLNLEREDSLSSFISNFS